MSYPDDLKALQSGDAQLAEELASIASLEKLLPWLQRKGVPLDQLDLFTQDEYTHDLIVPINRGRYWLVFGMT